MTAEDRSKLRAELSMMGVPYLKKFRAMLLRLGKSAGQDTKETIQLVDYMLEEQADLTF